MKCKIKDIMQDDCRYEKKMQITVALTLFLNLVLLITLNIAVSMIFEENVNDLTASVSGFYIEHMRYALWPEPTERIQFITTLLVMPITTVSIIKIIQKYGKNITDNEIYYRATMLSSIIIVACLVVLALKKSPDNVFIASPTTYYRDIRNMIDRFVNIDTILYTLCGALMISQLRSKKMIAISLGILVSVLLVGMFIINLSTAATYYGWIEHFNAVFYSVDQVMKGKTLMVNLSNQYGMYPHFLEPLFKLIGFDVVIFTSTMSVLNILAHACIYGYIYKSTKSHIVSCLTVIAILYIRYYLFIAWDSGDSYFQYNPIRLLFPCVFLYLGQSYLNSGRNDLAIIISIISAASILWNVDSGIVVFIAWITLLVFQAYKDEAISFKMLRKILIALVANLLVLIAVFAAYAFVMWIRSGEWIDISQLIRYQRIFFLAGYFMMHMPIFNAWNLVTVVYLIGFTYSIHGVIVKKSDIFHSEVFLISIVGLGIFSYYQGRSHDYNLLTVSYPAVMLVALAVGRMKLKSSINLFTRISFSAAMYSLVFCTVLLLESMPKIANTTTDRIASFYNILGKDELHMPSERIVSDFISKNTIEGEEVLILMQPDFYDSFFYNASHTTNPLGVPGGSERVLVSDFEEIHEFLKTNIDIKVFSNLDFRYAPINDILKDKYKVKESNPHVKLLVPNR